MTDADLLIDLPDLEFGSGVIGVCDVCQKRQAVIVLSKERFKLCVIDFLNKKWIGSPQKPGAPLAAYKSERVWFPTTTTKTGRAAAIVLRPTKLVKHPAVLITPDVYGITTALLDGAVRMAREGFEVLIPELEISGMVGPLDHLVLRFGARIRGGVPIGSARILKLRQLYDDALTFLRAGALVDGERSAVFGISYGASLAIALAAQDQKLSAVALAYPVPVAPAEIVRLVTAPTLLISGRADRLANRALRQFRSEASADRIEVIEAGAVRHNFLSRDLSAYDLVQAEEAWRQILLFLRARLVPPPLKPPSPPGPAKVATPPAPASAAAASLKASEPPSTPTPSSSNPPVSPTSPAPVRPPATA